MTDYVTLLQGRLLMAVEERRTEVRDATRRGYVHGYNDGFAAGIAEAKHAQTGLVRALERTATRWIVRGQKRTRATYAQPHPGDYPGQLLP